MSRWPARNAPPASRGIAVEIPVSPDTTTCRQRACVVRRDNRGKPDLPQSSDKNLHTLWWNIALYGAHGCL